MVWNNTGRFEAQHIFDGSAPQSAQRIPTYLTTAMNQLSYNSCAAGGIFPHRGRCAQRIPEFTGTDICGAIG
jgi:hypothetical protein